MRSDVGDSGWLSSAATVELCNKGTVPPDERLCRIAYLGRHATGQDQDRGPHEEWIILTEVADFCDEGPAGASRGRRLFRTPYLQRFRRARPRGRPNLEHRAAAD